MAKYFVTGATGFIGGEIVKQLVGRGHKVVALVRSPGKDVILKALGVEIHVGDITDRETPHGPDDRRRRRVSRRRLVQGRRQGTARRSNQRRRHAQRLDRRCARSELPRGVYTSTLAVFSDTKGAVPDEHYRYDGPHLSEYDRTKWIAHYRVALPKIEEGLPLSIVMPGLVYGPGDTSGMHTALVDLLRGRLPMTPARTAFCWAHVEDTARAPHSRDGARQIGRDLHHRRSAAHVRVRVRSSRVDRQRSRAALPPRPAHDARHGGWRCRRSAAL